MPLVTYSPNAADDLIGIAEFIARDKPQAAMRWIDSIKQTCNTLASNPEMGESRLDLSIVGCRSFSVGRYVIFFRSSPDGIEVARIVHGSRDVRNA